MEYINSRNVKEDSEFPYLVLHRKNEMTIPRTPGFQTYHWHQDLQLVYVMEGSVCVKTLEKKEILSAGEGILINKNVVHMVDHMDMCEYKCFIFPERLVSFYPGSPVARLTQTITENSAMPLIRFSPENDWCREVLELLKKLVEIEKNPSEFYECEVLANLSMAWSILLQHTKVPERMPEHPVSVRMRKMLEFMEQNYAEEISLEQMAQSASVSRSEAIRCFRQTMQTTPYRYLMNFRLEKAEALLKETSLPISQIALQTGFHEQAYFGKCFREKMGCAPREYRKKEVFSFAGCQRP